MKSIIPLIYFWLALLIVELGVAVYLISGLLRMSGNLLHRKHQIVAVAIVLLASLLLVVEISMFYHEITLTTYSNAASRDQWIMLATELPLLFIASLFAWRKADTKNNL